MPKTTELTTANLLIYPSEKLAKADDGGGLMRGVPLTGAVNELFNPTSDIELVNGGFDARLVYPAVLTDDLTKLYGAYVIVGERPEMDNVSILLFPSAYYGEQYANAKYRIESYSAPTIESRMTLMGKALAGSKLVQCYQRVGEALPLVGERYCLKHDSGKIEYFRIAKVSGEVRTFTNPKTGKDFQRLVVKIRLTDTLTNDHQGVAYSVEGYADAETKVLETMIADSASYYGIRPLAADAIKESATIQVDSIYEQLVPTTTTDTAWADQYPAGVPLFIPLGGKQIVFKNQHWDGGNLYLPCSVQPSSIELNGYTDESNGQLVSTSGNVIEVDYAAGMIRNLPSGWHEIKAVPACRVSNSAYSAVINVDQTNQSTEWAPFLTPKPAEGSVRVSWLTGGQWYDLIDNGDYNLRDSHNKVRGTVTRDGSCAFSLPDMPDAGSKIVVMWSPVDYYFNLDGNSPASILTPRVTNDSIVTISDETDLRPIVAGSVHISDGVHSATDDGNSHLVGDFTGTVDYSTGEVAGNFETASITLQCERYTSEIQTKRLAISSYAGTGLSGDLGQAVQPHSFTLAMNIVAYRSATSVLKFVSGRRATGGFTQWKIPNTHGTRWKNIPKYEKTFGYSSATSTTGFGKLLIVGDDGKGNLTIDGTKIIGQIDYNTGIFNCSPAYGGLLLAQFKKGSTTINANSPKTLYNIADSKPVATDVTFDVDTAVARFVSDASKVSYQKTLSTGKNTLNALASAPRPALAIFNSWQIEIEGKTYYERDGLFYDAVDKKTGNGDIVGKIDKNGTVSLNIGHGKSIKIMAGVYALEGMEIYSVYGRTPACPVLPQSFFIRANAGDKVSTGQSQADGTISGDLNGIIAETTGFYAVKSDEPIQPETVKYNVTTQSYIPLPKELIGIDTVRLRPDGKVPIFRLGDTVVIHNRMKHDIGSSHTGGQTVSVGRGDVDFLCVKDAEGKHVNAELYDYDLDAGTITWNSPLDLSNYTMPLVIGSSREQLNRITGLDISGKLELQNALGRDYPAAGTFVSSALVHGTLESTWTNPFEQQAWTKVWSDNRIGDEILAKLNTTDYPIKLTNDGAITERWLIRFKDGTQFDLIGEHLGLVMRSDTLEDLTPINPSTQKPYFTLPKAAFGTSGESIWAAGNCIRFNTTGTNIPTWLIKTVQPSTEKQSGTNGFDVCMRGNTTKK